MGCPNSALIRSLGMIGKQVPALDGSAAWLRECAFGADSQVTNWLFTGPRFWPDLAHFPGFPPFSSISKREARVSKVGYPNTCAEGSVFDAAVKAIGLKRTPVAVGRPPHLVESLSGCIPRSLLRAAGLLPCCPNTPQLAAGIFISAMWGWISTSYIDARHWCGKDSGRMSRRSTGE